MTKSHYKTLNQVITVFTLHITEILDQTGMHELHFNRGAKQLKQKFEKNSVGLLTDNRYLKIIT